MGRSEFNWLLCHSDRNLDKAIKKMVKPKKVSRSSIMLNALKEYVKKTNKKGD